MRRWYHLPVKITTIKMFVAVALAGAMGLDATTAQAQTGNEMGKNCRSFLKDKIPDGEYFNAGLCGGVVAGVTDTLKVAHFGAPQKFPVCIPDEGFTMGQAARIVVKYFDDHPESLNRDATVLAIKAFAAAYPCK